MQWAQWEHEWVDPLHQSNSEAEYDNDIWDDAAASGPDVANLYGMW